MSKKSISEQMAEFKKKEQDEFRNGIQQSSEAKTYFLIQQMGIEQFMLSNTMEELENRNDDDYEKYKEELQEEYLELSKQIAYVASSTNRFGVEIETATDDMPFPEQTESYWEWYKKWNDWDNSLSPEKFKEISHLIEADENIDEYLLQTDDVCSHDCGCEHD